MKNKRNQMIEKVVTTNGFTFTYTPSLKVLGVTSPNGKLEIFHQMEEQKANELIHLAQVISRRISDFIKYLKGLER